MSPAEDLEQRIAAARARIRDWAAKAVDWEQAREGAPERLATIEAEIEALLAADPAEGLAGASLAELEARRDEEEQALDLARQEALALDAEASRRLERRKRLPELRAAANERLLAAELPTEQFVDEDGAEPSDGEALLAQLERSALQGEVDALQAELASFEARGQVLAKRRDLASVLIEQQEARLKQLRAAVKTAQQAEAEREVVAARAATLLADDMPESVRTVVAALAERNVELARLRVGEEGLVEQIDEVTAALQDVEAQIGEVDGAFGELEARIAAAGLDDSIGLLLREHRGRAPDVGKFRRFKRMRRDTVAEVQLRQIELRERRRELANVDQRAKKVMAELAEELSPGERSRIQLLLRQLFTTERDTTDALLADYDAFFEKLVDLDAREHALVEKAERLIQFIDERILWVPSGTPPTRGFFVDAFAGLRWLFAARYHEQIGNVLADVAGRAPLLNLLLLIVAGAALAVTPRTKRQIRALGERARVPSGTSFAPTWHALGLTLALAAWAPALAGWLAWRIATSAAAAQYARSVAHGLLAAVFVWATLRVVRAVLRSGGLAEAHFGWPASSVRRLRRQLVALTAVLVPALFLVRVFELRGEAAWHESIGRLAFVVAMLATSLFALLVLREPDGAVTAIWRALHPALRSWSRRVVVGVAIGLPILLALASLRGYYATALAIAVRAHETAFLGFLLLLVGESAGRWTQLAGRRVALERARAEQLARAEAAAARADDGDVPVPVAPDEPVDLAKIQAQTSGLVRSALVVAALLGLFTIWSDVLPAAGLLREVELWSTSRDVNLTVVDAGGAERTVTERRAVPVTLADLFLAALLGAIAFALVRNLPGLLEVSLFRRLVAGERYAYSTIIKYAITLGGIVLVFDTLGVGWSSIQWLVAAVGLGLGFGLQEIFANFISGLIILFERPIRVGDTVTVGDVSGTVSRIRIRATWITAFDRKELVVPNKEFVTTRLINWSLSDPTLRVDIPLGIAYGSDTERAIEVLMQVAKAHPHVLAEPPPQVFFLRFGDSVLEFELRVFSPDVSHTMTIRHDLHMAIDRAFREAGIEIAFRQTDIHVRSMPAEWLAPPHAGTSAKADDEDPGRKPA